MSAKYGVTIQLNGPKHDEDECLGELTASLRKCFTDRYDGQVSYTLPAIPGTVIDQPNADLKVRTYASPNGTYVGVAHKGFAPASLTIKVPGVKAGATLKNLVTNEVVPARLNGDVMEFDVNAGPVELNAYLIH